MRIYSTAGVPPERRAAYWNAVYQQFSLVNVAPVQPEPFKAELRLGNVGPLSMAVVRSDGAHAERTKDHAARASERNIGILILLKGQASWSHCGQEGVFSAGDILISDNSRPMTCRHEGPSVGVTIHANDAMLRAHLPFIDEVCGMRLPSNTGLARAATAMAKCFADQAENGFPIDYGTAMATHFLDVLATSYAMAAERPSSSSSVVSLRKALARQFIESHLTDPDLTPHSIAEALRISPRYLRMLMAGDGETASAVILRRRLEECAKQLASPHWRDRTITEIAFSWGFNSTAHFARVFKNKFGVTPRDYRQAAIDMECGLSA